MDIKFHIYICDNKRHLICLPYSEENLHMMADDLGIGRHFFHKKDRGRSHYDIPALREEEIMNRCLKVQDRQLLQILMHPELHELLMDKSVCPSSVGHMAERHMKGRMWWRVQGDDVVCNFCGSWHPQSFIEFLREAADPMNTESMIELSDRRHKVYVTRDGISNASKGAIKCYLVHVKQEAEKQGFNIPSLDRQLQRAFIVSNDKFSIRLEIMKEKWRNQLE